MIPVLIPFQNCDVDLLIELVAQYEGSFFLDSSLYNSQNRYSYFSYRPTRTGIDLSVVPFEISDATSDFWSGGYVGWVDYEKNSSFAYYPIVLVINHQTQEFFIASHCAQRSEVLEWSRQLMLDLSHLSRRVEPEPKATWIQKPDFSDYQEKFEKVKHYLEAGDVYQVNLTTPFQAKTNLGAAALYTRLRSLTPSPYGAFINADGFFVLSASPELFFRIDGDRIQSKPIKGTRARGQLNDDQVRTDLMNSPKDRAELLMICDLERNDLGRICQTGTIKVPHLCEIESYSTVHHLVATINGQLRMGVLLQELFDALFPGGSVTGAPKIRAMQIISELERRKRGIYTGALGYVGGGQALFNLPIRTMIYRDGFVDFSAGGGVVIDSDVTSEFEEIWCKVEGMMRALGVSRPK